jgi:hypothetical protein
LDCNLSETAICHCLSNTPSQQPEESSKNKPEKTERQTQALQVACMKRVIRKDPDEQNKKDHFKDKLGLLNSH